MKRDNAFTGLEAAIVLIAFVVVAAVFSYVMLGAGFFATQKAQEVTYASIKQATSNVVYDGVVYGNVTKGNLTGFTFSVKVPGGGQPVDMTQTIFTYTSTYEKPPKDLRFSDVDNNAAGTLQDSFAYPTCSTYPCYNAYFPKSADGTGVSCGGGKCEVILFPGNTATYLVTIADPTAIDNCGVNKNNCLGADTWFSLEMTPHVGASTQITKTLASSMQNGKPLL